MNDYQAATHRSMTVDEAVATLDALERGDDREAAHDEADTILMGMVPEAVAAAYGRARERVGFWYA
jgi:hypothetical protein